MAISRRMQEGASQVPKKGAGTKSPEFEGFLSGRSGRGGGFCWKAWLEPPVFEKLKGRQDFWKDHTRVLKARLLCTVSYVRPWTASWESIPTEPLVWQVRPMAPFDQDFGYDRLLITYDPLHNHVIMKISTNPTWAPPRRSPLLRESQTQFFSLHDHARSSSDRELVCKETLKIVDSLWLFPLYISRKGSKMINTY